MTGPPLVHRLLAGGPRLSVGVISADLLHLGDALALLEETGVEIVHLDVGDGVFSPMFTVGPPLIAALKTDLVKDVHLMIDDPLAKIASVAAAGADMITFHVEGVRQPHRVLAEIGTAIGGTGSAGGIVRGVAITPSTPVDLLEPLIDDLDYVLILAIDPGWGGQRFQPSTSRRLAAARRLIEASGRPVLLGVDGGVTRDNIAEVVSLGADIIVSGSAIFDGRDPREGAQAMLAATRVRV
jgi:ribulose-phosphate 3-epimerase